MSVRIVKNVGRDKGQILIVFRSEYLLHSVIGQLAPIEDSRFDGAVGRSLRIVRNVFSECRVYCRFDIGRDYRYLLRA